jgi:HAD superfamily hydrolase (TIGR01450 family)
VSGPLVADYTAVVCDLDGVVYRGQDPVPHAVESISALEVPVLFATNNASRPAAEVAERLRRMGLRCEPDQVATSAQAAAWLLSRELAPATRVLAVGGEGVPDALREVGLVPVSPGAEGGQGVSAVAQGYGRTVTADDLAAAAYAVESGARWYATNTDATLPTERGLAPGNGSLVAAVATAAGRGPDVVAGKPESPLYELCAQRLGITVDRVLAVGDRLDTDIAGAVAAGMSSLLVLTGVDDLESLLDAPGPQRPTYVAADLRALHRAPEDAPDGTPSVTELGEAVARAHAAMDRKAGAAEVDRARQGARDVLRGGRPR